MGLGGTIGRWLRLVPLALAVGCMSDVSPWSGGGGDDDDDGPGIGQDEEGDPGEGGAVEAPELLGEPRADHRFPSWLWSVPDGAVGFRVRIDDAPWSDVDLDTTWLTAPSELDDGEHHLEVAGRDASGLAGPASLFRTNVEPIARDGDLVWRQDRTMTTSPLGHPCAVAAAATSTDDVHDAQNAGADLIELDAADAAGILDDTAVGAGDEVLVLRLDDDAGETAVRAVLDALAGHRADIAHAGRHVVLRASPAAVAALDVARDLLDTRDYLLLRPYVRTAVILDRDAATRALLLEAAERGDDLVSLEYRTPELMSLRAVARALGLGVMLHGTPQGGDVFVAALRESFDAVTVPADVSDARAIIERPSALFHVDAAVAADDAAEALPYRGIDGATRSLAVNHDSEPLLRTGAMDDAMPGSSLVFDPAEQRAAPLQDADSEGGILLAVSARLAQTQLADGAVMTMVAKSEHSGWSLDLANPEGTDPTVMRFSVHVDGAYHYTTVSTSRLTTTRAHLIIAAYDGDGEVNVWIDNDATGVTEASASGDILGNDYPVIVGADPEPAGEDPRFYFDGEIDVVVGESWAPL